jgi:hypothetical protein
MAGMKVIPLLVAGDDRVREDVLLVARTMVHGLRTNTETQLIEITRKINALRRDVDRLIKNGDDP